MEKYFNSEIIECNAWRHMLNSISQKNKNKYSIDVRKNNSAEAYAASFADILAFNRAVNINSGDQLYLEDIIDFYKSKKIPRFFLQINPLYLNEELEKQLENLGFKYYNNWVKLHRDNSPVKEVKSELIIEQSGNGSIRIFSDIIIKSFEWDPELSGFFSDYVLNSKLFDGKSGWIFYIGYYKDKPASVASLYIENETGWLGFAATLKDYRKLGGQHALVRQRLVDGINNGCKNFVVETAENLPDKRSQSYLNLIDMGFELAYLRPNYIFYCEE